LARELCRDNPGLRVVYMSGYSGDGHERVTDSNMTWIEKPFSRAALAEKLRSALTTAR
jgi:FixJ family two-component response regulator